MSFAALALAAAAAFAAAPPAPGPEASRSTAAAPGPAAPAPDAPELKRRIRKDQKEVLRARAAVKTTRAGGGEAAKAKALQAWHEANAKLRADRALLKKVIGQSEAERDKTRRRSGSAPKNDKLKP